MLNLTSCILLIHSLVAPMVTLRVTVEKIQPGKGNIVVAVYDTQKYFFKKPLLTKTARAGAPSQDFSFDIPANGTYAVAVYQDINENEQLDKGIFSIPKEPYGLSNNFRPRFSAPTFDDCKFYLGAPMGITILLK